MNGGDHTLDFTEPPQNRKARHYIKIKLYSVTVTKTVFWRPIS